MSRIRTVNMRWERRLRGAYPVSPYALGDDGRLTLAVPRPLATRTFDLTRIAPDGGMESHAGFTAETLLRLHLLAASDNALGMTIDDIYLLRAGAKTRFLADHHVTYLDVGLSEDGERVAACLSDMAGASFTLAFGEIGGRVEWMRDVDAPLTVVAISRDGSRVAIGAETGTIRLVDSARRDLWQFDQEAPIRALAASRTGESILFGGQAGVVGSIDREGARRWALDLEEEIDGLAISGDGALCAVSSRGDGSETSCVRLLDAEGRSGWEFDLGRPSTGVALSPDGRWLAASGEGLFTLFEIVIGAETGQAPAAPSAAVIAGAEKTAGSGHREGACRALRDALALDPSNPELFDAFVRERAAWRDAQFEQARSQAAAGELEEAIRTLEALTAFEPLDAETAPLLAQLHASRAGELVDAARRLAAAGDAAGAEQALMGAIAHDPLLADARRELFALRDRLAEDALRSADALLKQGSFDEAADALERAQGLRPSPETERRLADALTEQEFAAGRALYDERRYREAIFQFQKVLARKPDHADARRWLGYAESLLKESAAGEIADRFSRLE